MNDASSGSPLRPNWFHVLVALADRDRHGSAIARDVLTQTGGALRLWPATLYRTLDDMASAGLIEDVSEETEDEGGRRRVYRITGAGRGALAEDAERLAVMAGTARRRLGRA